MKIMFFIRTLLGGGAEKVLSDLVINLNNSKYDITVISLYNEGIYINKIKDKVQYRYVFETQNCSDKLKRIKYKFGYWFKYIPTKILWLFCVHHKYDIEIAFMEGISTKIVSGSINSHSKKIAWIHTDLINNTEAEGQFFSFRDQLKSYSKFDNVVGVSSGVKKSFEEKFGIAAQVQYNIIDEKAIIDKSIETIEENNLFDKFTIISVGRLTEPKGYERLLRVHKKLIEEGFDYRLLILGEGEKRPLLENFIDDNQLSESVSLLGFKDNPYKYMAKANLFVCSSIAEGFSTVATEAVVLGIPILTTNCAGMEDLLGNSEYGLITKNNEEDLYLGLKKLIQDKSTYEFYKNKVKERSQSFKMSKRLEEYEQILDK